MTSKRKLDKDAVQAAREFLLGRSAESDATPGRRNRAVSSDESARTSESSGVALTAPEVSSPASRLELSAPHIRRTASGWRARCIHQRGVDSRHVNDARYGGYIGSFLEALDVRDRFFRERGLPIPWEIEAVLDGERVAPEIVRRKRSIVVRWQGQEHEVSGADAEEIATEIALDLFVEFLNALQHRASER